MLLLLALSGCGYFGMDEAVVLSTPVTVNKDALTIELEPPLSRRHGSVVLHARLDVEWTPQPPNYILIRNGSLVAIGITLITDTGREYSATNIDQSYGSHGPSLRATFEPEVPRGLNVVGLRLWASMPVTFLRIEWFDYNPH